VPSGEFEVVVCAQERQIVPNAQLRKQRVDRADLHACSAARIAEISGCDMIFSIRQQQGKRCEALDDLCTGLRSGESLKQFLENQAGRDDDVGSQQGIFEQMNFRLRARGVATQGERPNARVDKQGHDLERSAL
jgi:hypothetical protein